MNSRHTKRALHVMLTLVVVAGAATLGFGLYRWFGPEPPITPAAAPVPPESDAMSPAPATIPATLPHFVLNDENNKARSVQDWKGKSLVLNFWATWCAPCRREIPLLISLQAERAPQNFQVIGIAMDVRESVLSYAKEAAISYPLLIGEQEAADLATRLGIRSIGLPFTVFTDNQGRIVTLRLGELQPQEANGILDAVSALNDGSLTLEQARDKIAQIES